MNPSRGGAVAARRVHTPEVAGSSPAPATKKAPASAQPDCRLSGLRNKPTRRYARRRPSCRAERDCGLLLMVD